MTWPELCEKLLTRLETSGVDTTAERGEFAVLVAECGSSGCKMVLSQKGISIHALREEGDSSE